MTLLLHIASIFMTSHSFEMLILGPKVKQIQEKRDKTIIAINKYLLYKSFEMIETLVTKSKFFRKPQYAKTALNSEELFMLQHYRIRLSIELYTKSYFGTPKNERAKTKPGLDPMYVHEVFDDALQTFFSNQNYKQMTTELQDCKGNGIEMSSEAISDAYRLYIIHYLHNAVYKCIHNTRKDKDIWHKFLVSLYKDCVYGVYCGIDIMRDYDGVYTHLFECIEFKESTNFYDDIKNFFAKSALSFDKGEQVPKKKILLIDFSWYFISFLTDIEDAENRNTLFNTIEKYLGTIIDCLRVNSKKMRSMDQNLELLHLSSCSFSMINSLSDIEKMFCFSEIDMAKFKDLFTIANSLRLVILHYKDMLRKNLVQILVSKNDKICMKHKQPGNLPLTSTKKNNDETEIEEVKNVVSVNFEVDKFVKFRVIISSKIDSSAKEAALCEDFGTCETLMQIKVGDQQYDKLSKFCGFEALKNTKRIEDITESVQSSIPKPKKNKWAAEIAKDGARPSIDLKSQAVEGNNKIDTDRFETLEDSKQSSLPKEIDSELHIERRQATAARNENQADSGRDYQNVDCIDHCETQACESNMQNEKDIDLLPIASGEDQASTNKCNALPGSVTASPKDNIQNSLALKAIKTLKIGDSNATVEKNKYPDPRANDASNNRAHTTQKDSLQGSKNNEQNAGNVQDTIPVHADVSKVSESSKNPPDTFKPKEQLNLRSETSLTFFEGSKKAEKEYNRLRQSKLKASTGSDNQEVSNLKNREVTTECALKPDKHQPDSTDATAGTLQFEQTAIHQQQAAEPLQCPSNQDCLPLDTASELTKPLNEEDVNSPSDKKASTVYEIAPPNTSNEQRTRSQSPIPDKFDLEAAESERIDRIARAENEREAIELFSALYFERCLLQAELEKSIAIEMDKKEENELFSVLDLETSLIQAEFEYEKQKCSEALRTMTNNAQNPLQ